MFPNRKTSAKTPSQMKEHFIAKFLKICSAICCIILHKILCGDAVDVFSAAVEMLFKQHDGLEEMDFLSPRVYVS
jgi:hypothetical protein